MNKGIMGLALLLSTADCGAACDAVNKSITAVMGCDTMIPAMRCGEGPGSYECKDRVKSLYQSCKSSMLSCIQQREDCVAQRVPYCTDKYINCTRGAGAALSHFRP